MAFQQTMLGSGAQGLAAVVATVSLHTANPGTTGTDEVTGGGYARQPVTWGPPQGTLVYSSGVLLVSAPPGTIVTHIGLWDPSGVYQGSLGLSTPTTIGAAGAIQLPMIALANVDANTP